jgi:hypothetical protein
MGESERAQLLTLTTQLEQPELNMDARLNIVAQMRSVLNGKERSQMVYPLSIPAMVEPSFT